MLGYTSSTLGCTYVVRVHTENYIIPIMRHIEVEIGPGRISREHSIRLLPLGALNHQVRPIGDPTHVTT